MAQSLKRGLYWFRHDLRLHDNPALVRFCAEVDEAMFVFVIDPRWFKSGHYQSAHMGVFRFQFLMESLHALKLQLNDLGQDLLVVSGYPVQVLSDLVQQREINAIASNYHPGSYEKQQWQVMCDAFPACQLIQTSAHMLFHPDQLPFSLHSLPAHFTPFRKWVEDIVIDPCLAAPEKLPTKMSDAFADNEFDSLLAGLKNNEALAFTGGTNPGSNRLNYYLFETQKLLNYKQTRNGLLQFDDSSKLSPWLANGCLSAKQVYHQIKLFEATVGANESTYWLYFELLWREYFQWYLELHGSRLFKFDGIKKTKPLTSFWPERFAKWCNGDTPYPIVNACMRQLNNTGYMSNRGRQLVASCLVHELQMDWRYGAAYFEQQLVDFDVASNWGNWQYLAGVGADPRGHRRFDLEKQARTYDPDGAFVAQWQGQQGNVPLDSSDMVDWPTKWH
ncbi:MAG: DASH family cryptochrome [Aestuariibacter sp.]